MMNSKIAKFIRSAPELTRYTYNNNYRISVSLHF